ncbi:flagellar protein FlaG [Hirschia maritima]|uniref:flagellar protein FlaG n=1 Tax=Hirschia maritima TaxID=1121961 RepID=UPI00039BFE8E|nr:flagellar protein FlaG [Hirschia maritima]
MGTELTPVPATSSKLDVVRPDRVSLDTPQDDQKTVNQAIEARRKQFVEEIARQHGLEKGKLVIEKDSETGRYVHSLIDPESGEVIRQWPDVDWLKFAKESNAGSSATQGLWLDQKI